MSVFNVAISIDAFQFADELDAACAQYSQDNDGAALLRGMNGHAATEFRLTRVMLARVSSMAHVVAAMEAAGTVRDARIHLYGPGEGAPQHRDALPNGVHARVFVSITTDTQQQQQQAVNSWRLHALSENGDTAALLHQHDVTMTNGTGVVMDRLGCGTEHTGSAVIEHVVHPMQPGCCRGTAVFNLMLWDDVSVHQVSARLAAAVPASSVTVPGAATATAAAASAAAASAAARRDSCRKLVRPAVEKGCMSRKTTEYNNQEVMCDDGQLRKNASINGKFLHQHAT